MADEITINIGMSCTNGNFRFSKSYETDIDQTGVGGGGGTPTITTDEELLDWGEISTAGILSLYNMDSTNTVEVGVMVDYVFQPVIKVRPEQFVLIEPYSSLYVRTDAGTAQLEWKILEQ